MEADTAAKHELEASLAGVSVEEQQHGGEQESLHGPHSGSKHSGQGALSSESPAAAQTPSLEPSAASPSGGVVYSASKKSRPETWDPLAMPTSAPTTWCLRRIKKDLRSLYCDPLPGIFVYVDERDFTLIHALVVGPFETPYEGGFFYFVMKCPDDYPHNPPKVRLMTTGGGTVRFNPNLYKEGKVCLSILGTWQGPAWSPGQTLGSVLLSIQSLMSERPYHNEPGFEQERQAGDANRYNDCIRHETMRVAVCDMLDGKTPMPAALVSTMEETYKALADHFLDAARAQLHLDGAPIMDMFKEDYGVFRYAKIIERLEILKTKFQSAGAQKDAEEADEEANEEGEGEDGGL